MSLPIIYSAPHASSNFGEFVDRILLSSEQQVRYSDYGTDQTVPRNGEVIIAQYSRGLGDLNRSPNDPTLFREVDFWKPQPNKIWKDGEGLTEDEKQNLIDTAYKPYHNQLLELIQNLYSPGLVIDWHNTAHYVIGNKQDGTPAMMKPIILSNLCDEAGPPTCDMKLLKIVKQYFAKELRNRSLPSDIYLNYVYTGGYITCHYNTFRTPELSKHQIQSFQVEYDTIITHDQETLEPNEKVMHDLKEAFEITMEKTFPKYLKLIS